MNKQKFVEYLRSPESLSESQFQELEQLLIDYPYFSIAKSVAARASKTLDNTNKSDLIASAAIYATDRRHLKRYVNGEVVFLADAPKIKTEISKEKSEKSKIPLVEEVLNKEPLKSSESDIVVPDKMETVHSDVDQILDELQRDMEELKKSRLHFVEIQNQLDDDVAHRPFQKSKSESDESASQLKEEKEIKQPKGLKDKDSNITNLIDSLKKEFAEESEEKADSKIEKSKSAADESEDKKEKPKKSIKQKAKSKRESGVKTETKASKKEKNESKEISKPNLEKSGKPSIVTNMDDGDEDQETTALDPKDKPIIEEKKEKIPARANRGSRQKVKREDLEKLMGLPTKTVLPKESKLDSKESSEEKKVKKQAAKKTTATKKSDSKKAEAKKAKEEKEKIEQESESGKTIGLDQENEPSNRESARAFKDFGGTGDMSSSVSRASSSRRKRSTRSSKSNSDSGEKKGDDDDSAGPNDLIEKFITQNPSIQRRALKDNKSDLSEQSSEWQPDLASEYLAEIYLKQGNKQRAVQIYEALMLKFPEKKSYFAALIEKIQG